MMCETLWETQAERILETRCIVSESEDSFSFRIPDIQWKRGADICASDKWCVCAWIAEDE